MPGGRPPGLRKRIAGAFQRLPRFVIAGIGANHDPAHSANLLLYICPQQRADPAPLPVGQDIRVTQERHIFDIFQTHYTKERIRGKGSIPGETFRLFSPVVLCHLRVVIFLGEQKLPVPACRSINDRQGGLTVAFGQLPYLYVTQYVSHEALPIFSDRPSTYPDS